MYASWMIFNFIRINLKLKANQIKIFIIIII